MSKLHRTLLAFSLLFLAFGCSSRYKYDLYQTADELRRKVKVEETKFIPNTVLNDPNAFSKFTPGMGNTLIVTTGTRGLTHETDDYSVLRFDEYLRCDIYFEVSNPLKTENIELVDHSFLWVRGRYDQTSGARLFLPESGTVAIDSLRGEHLYGTLNGVFVNADKVPLAFDGHFKVKFKN